MYPRHPRRVASARAPTLALAHKDPDIGRGARSARPLGTPRPRAARLSDATRRGRRGYFARRRAAGLGMRDFASELFRREIPRPLHPRPHGRAARVAAGHRMGPHPPHPRPNPQPPHNGPAREVPAPPSARDVRTGLHVGPTTARRAKYPRRPRRVASTLSHLMRPPHARPARRETLPKKSDFFCHRRMPTAYILVSGVAWICAVPNKTRGVRRFGRRVRRVYFFLRPPCAHGGCVVYSWRL